MNKYFRYFAFSGCVIAAVSAAQHAVAHDGHASHGIARVATAAASKHPIWRFTLATLQGDRFVRSTDFNGPILVNFWSRDCAPCIAELPRLQAFAKANAEWTVLLVATESAHDAQAFLNDRGITLTSLRAGADARALLRVAGNPSGALPYSHAQRENGACFAKLGELSELDFEQLSAGCGVAAGK